MLEILCRLFGHRRSTRHRHRTEGVWQSQCVSCDAPLVRLTSGQWVEMSSPAGKEFIRVSALPALRPSPDGDPD